MTDIFDIEWLSSAYDNASNRYMKALLRTALKLVHTTRIFFSDRMSNKASALTYSTLLSAIPFLAIVFAIAKGFGVSQIIERTITSALHDQTEISAPIVDTINTYIDHTKSGLFVGIGLVILLITVFNMTSTIEGIFNDIWQLKRQRPIMTKVTDYFSVLLLAPVLIITMSGLDLFLTNNISHLPSWVASTSTYLMLLLPLVISSLIFMCLFKFMPNTWVSMRHVVIPSIIAGALFLGFQNLCFGSQIWLSNYNAIYGSFAAIPMFLLWAQVSWSICLYAAVLTFVSQNFSNIQAMEYTRIISPRERGFVAVMVLSLIFKRYREAGKDAYTSAELSDELELPIRIANRTIHELTDAGWLNTLEHNINEEVRYIPSRDLTNISISDVVMSLTDNPSGGYSMNHKKYKRQWMSYNALLQSMGSSEHNVRIGDLS